MNLSIFIPMLLALQLLYWIVGRRTSKNANSNEDYFLAKKSVRFFPLMMTFLATQVGGGTVLGAAEEAYRFGWPVLLYPLGGVLGLILLGFGVGRKLAGFQVSTIAQIFEVFYGSIRLKQAASILSVISLFMILVGQVIASSKFLVSLGVNSPLLFVAFWGVVILYTTQGGLKAVISTDLVQGLFFSLVFLFSFGWVLYSAPSSVQMAQFAQFASVSSKLCGWLLMPLFFMVIEQDMGQRCFAGASPRIVSQAALWAGIGMMIVCIVPVFFGALASSMGIEVTNGGSVLMAVIEKLTNPWISALVGCAVLAAVISTGTSLINAISSNLSGDFNISFLQGKNAMRRVRGMTFAISVAAIFFAFYFDNVVDMLIQSYELSVSCLFIPIFFALFKKRGNGHSCWLAISFGALGFCLFRIAPIPFPKEIASLLLSLFGYGLGEIVIRKSALIPKKQVD